jgi:RNA polymerase sigma-70 factor (ECF subfamily)
MITLYHLEEMPYQEIAKVTGVPEGTVKSYLFRARKRLKELLEKDYLKEELR